MQSTTPSVILSILLVLLNSSLWFGKTSIQTLVKAIEENEKVAEENQLLVERNSRLRSYVSALKNDDSMLEDLAREELHFIKPNETFIRILD